MVSKSLGFRVRRRTTKKTNKKLATVGAVKRMITRRLDKAVTAANTAGGASATGGTMYGVGSQTSVSRLYFYKLRFNLLCATAATSVRCIVFQYNDVTTPATADLLASSAYNSQYYSAVDFSKTVHVLADRTYSMNLSDQINKDVIINIPGKRLRKIGSSQDGYFNNFYCLIIASSTNVTVGTFYWEYEYTLE